MRWTAECDAALSQFREAVTNARILRYPEYDRPFEIGCDASDRAVGGVLLQRDSKGVARPIEFCSRQFTDAERHWHGSEKEAYAVVFCLEKWAQFLQPHRNLEVLFDFSRVGRNPRLWRWTVRFQDFDFTVVHIAGTAN